MALSLRGTGENSGIDGANLTINLPGGTATDDVVYVGFAQGTNFDADMLMVTASYVELADLFRGPTVPANLGVFRKVMGATPDSTAVCDGNTGSSGSTAGVVHVWTGVDTTAPEDATTTTNTADSSNPDSPSIDTATADAVVLSFGATNANDASITAPTNYINQVDVGSTDTFSCSVGVASRAIASPGTEDPGAWSNWSAAGGFPRHCAATVAVRPAGGGGGVDTSESRAGTSSAAATGTGRKEVQVEKRSTVSATATLTGRGAVQDAKRSTVTGTASVTGVSAFANANWDKAGTSSGQATVLGRVAVQDAKRSTIAGQSTVTGLTATFTEIRGTSIAAATLTGRIAAQDAKRSSVTGEASVVGVSDFTDESGGAPAPAAVVRDSPFIANVGSMMIR